MDEDAVSGTQLELETAYQLEIAKEKIAALEREKAELVEKVRELKDQKLVGMELISILKKENAELKQNMKAVNDYLQPNWSNDMPWYDEIIIAIDQRHSELKEKVRELEDEAKAISDLNDLINEKGRSWKAENAELTEKVRGLEAENAKTKKHWQELIEAEHALSDAYIRLRSKLKAFDTPFAPTCEQVWKHTEQKLDALLAENAEMKEKVRELEQRESFAKQETWFALDRANKAEADLTALKKECQELAAKVKDFFFKLNNK